MKHAKKILMWTGIWLLTLGLLFSIISTFFGSRWSQVFFSSTPLVVYWIVLLLLLLAGLAFYRSLRASPSLYMAHLGVIFVLVGGMYSSRRFHQTAMDYFGSDKEHSGYMLLEQNRPVHQLLGPDMQTLKGELPFKVNLLSFWLEYYRSGPALMTGVNSEGRRFVFELDNRFPAEFDINSNVMVRAVRKFENFKLKLQDGQRTAIDQKGLGSNPALEVEILRSDGSINRGYLFERFPQMSQVAPEFQLEYSAGRITGISDYKSYIQILSQDGSKPLAAAIIEVNKPLHFGGYHLYQYSYDNKNLEYTILYVVSDSGLYIVYAGLWLLGLGAAGRFWFRPAVEYLKLKKRAAYGN